VGCVGLCLGVDNATFAGTQVGPSEPTTKEYVVFSGNRTKQTQKLWNDFRDILGTPDVLEVGGPHTGPQFWSVDMNDQQVQRLSFNNPVVSMTLVGGD